MGLFDGHAINLGGAYAGFQFAPDNVYIVAEYSQRGARPSRYLALSGDVPTAFGKHAYVGIKPIPFDRMGHIAGLRVVHSVEENVLVDTSDGHDGIGREVDGCGSTEVNGVSIIVEGRLYGRGTYGEVGKTVAIDV